MVASPLALLSDGSSRQSYVLAVVGVLTLSALHGGCAKPSSGTANILSAHLVSPTQIAVSVDTCNATLSYDVEVQADAMEVRVSYSDWREGDDCADGIVVELPIELGERSLVDANGNDRITLVPGPSTPLGSTGTPTGE